MSGFHFNESQSFSFMGLLYYASLMEYLICFRKEKNLNSSKAWGHDITGLFHSIPNGLRTVQRQDVSDFLKYEKSSL